jgi:hypothetical protein
MEMGVKKSAGNIFEKNNAVDNKERKHHLGAKLERLTEKTLPTESGPEFIRIETNCPFDRSSLTRRGLMAATPVLEVSSKAPIKNQTNHGHVAQNERATERKGVEAICKPSVNHQRGSEREQIAVLSNG